MKGLLVSDIHYRLKQLDWVASVAGDFDLVVIAGDHLDIASVVELDAQIAVVARVSRRVSAARRGRRVLGQSRSQRAQRARGAVGANGSKARRRGMPSTGIAHTRRTLLITVCPWWDGPSTREVVARQLAATPMLVDDRQWIWVYHAPPDDSPTSWTGKRHYGDEDLVAWIERIRARPRALRPRPPVAVRGRRRVDRSHRQPRGLNAGCQIGPVPAYVELRYRDPGSRWSSLAGNERASFEVEALKREPVAP